MANNYLFVALPAAQVDLAQALGLILCYYAEKPSENETCANLLNGTLSIEDARALVDTELDPDYEAFDGERLNFTSVIDNSPSGDWLFGNPVVSTAQQAIWDECLATVVGRGSYYWRTLTPNGSNLVETNHPTIGVVGQPINQQNIYLALRDWEPT